MICGCCKEDKGISEFGKVSKNKSGLNYNCKLCHNTYTRQWYRKKPKKYHREKSKKFRARKRKIILDAKNVPCFDCNVCYPPCVMDFDHLRDKKFNVSNSYVRRSIPDIIKEISKCEVVCANCHRIRTFNRLNL